MVREGSQGTHLKECQPKFARLGYLGLFRLMTGILLICFGFVLLFLSPTEYSSSKGAFTSSPGINRSISRTGQVYYYFSAELRDGASPHQVAQQLTAEFVRKLESDNLYLFRKPKTLNVPNTQMREEIISQLRKATYLNFTSVDVNGIQGLHHIKTLNVLPLPQASSLSRRAEVSAVAERFKDALDDLGLEDPGIKEQWHLMNIKNPGNDLNVTGVWLDGFTGKGVTVAVIDDGVNHNHADIKDNYSGEGSFDFIANSPDPSPKTSNDTHGTPCAGLIAAKPNNVCGVGIAYGAKVSGIRLIAKGDITEAARAAAIQYRSDINDIYSCSWGPSDDGNTFSDVSELQKVAIINATSVGRDGKGSIYVFAAGNGAENEDNCSFDGFSNLIHTISVGAIDHDSVHAKYSEACTALMVSAYSNQDYKPAIYTTSSNDGECNSAFGGTSAATPQVAGIVALGLEARSDLTWRDVQNVLIQSAVPVQLEHSSWETTHSGRPYSTFFGYGKVDAYQFVKLAKSISLLGPQTNYTSPVVEVMETIPYNIHGLSSSIYVSEEKLKEAKLTRLEHVTVTVKIHHSHITDLFVDLVSPNGIRSPLVISREKDQGSGGFPDTTFLTVKHWHEPAVGNWSLIVYDLKDPSTQGQMASWQLTLYGESPAGLSALAIVIIVFSCIGGVGLIALAVFIYFRYFRKKVAPTVDL